MPDPAFLFYSSDFLTGVADLTMQERGQYITLLCLQHQKGHLNAKTICLSLGIESVNLVSDVIQKFKIDDQGLYYNSRLDFEIDRRKNFNESRRSNGSKGGRPKQNKKASENLMVSTSKASENLIEIENEIENDICKSKKYNSRFDDFWLAYPQKKGKGDAEKAWKALKPNNDLVDKMLESINKSKKSQSWQNEGGKYIPFPATWIRGKRWEDEELPIIEESPYGSAEVLWDE